MSTKKNKQSNVNAAVAGAMGVAIEALTQAQSLMLGNAEATTDMAFETETPKQAKAATKTAGFNPNKNKTIKNGSLMKKFQATVKERSKAMDKKKAHFKVKLSNGTHAVVAIKDAETVRGAKGDFIVFTDTKGRKFRTWIMQKNGEFTKSARQLKK